MTYSDEESDEDADEKSENISLGYKSAVDIWSLGCVLFHILTTTIPFKGNLEIMRRFCEGKRNWINKRLERQSPASRSFILRLLIPNPDERPNASIALIDEWLPKTPFVLDDIRLALSEVRDNHAYPRDILK